MRRRPILSLLTFPPGGNGRQVLRVTPTKRPAWRPGFVTGLALGSAVVAAALKLGLLS